MRKESAIEKQIAVGLYKLSLAVKHNLWVKSAKEHISPTHAQILAVLSLKGAMSLSALSEELGLALSTVSESVSALVRKGLIVKKPSPTHHRAKVPVLTEKGKGLGKKALSWAELLSVSITDLSLEEKQLLLSIIIKLIVKLQKQGLIPLMDMCATCSYFQPNAHKPPKPHHCHFVDAPLGGGDLKIECEDHKPATKRVCEKNFKIVEGIISVNLLTNQ